MHQVSDLIAIFNNTFAQSHNTRLVKGDDEPIYLPANDQTPFHQVVFAHGFYASALHEIAHWLVAGEARRKREDYGYWYCPDGRSKEQQLAFEEVEVKPQAIEWALSLSAGFAFNVSADNLGGEPTCRYRFQQRVYEQLCTLINTGFNQRTNTLLKALSDFYKTPYPLTLDAVVWQMPEEIPDVV